MIYKLAERKNGKLSFFRWVFKSRLAAQETNRSCGGRWEIVEFNNNKDEKRSKTERSSL